MNELIKFTSDSASTLSLPEVGATLCAAVWVLFSLTLVLGLASAAGRRTQKPRTKSERY